MNCNTLDAVAASAVPSEVPETPGDDVTTLWHSAYYDIPISGMCITPDGARWYHLISEIGAGDEPLIYALIALTAEEAALEHAYHQLFREHVGTHCDHGLARGAGVVRPSDQHAQFYDHPDREAAQARHARYLDRDIISWFSR